MSQPQLYALHPEAYNDIDEIREFIADDNPDAADRVVTEIFDSIRAFPRSHITPAPVQARA